MNTSDHMRCVSVAWEWLPDTLESLLSLSCARPHFLLSVRDWSYVHLDNPLPLCHPLILLAGERVRNVERSFGNGAKEKDLGLDAQDLAPAHSAHPPPSIHGSRTVRPTTN